MTEGFVGPSFGSGRILSFAMMNILRACIVCAVFLSARSFAQDESTKAPPLSPADSIATMRIQEGYRIEPVLTEPIIHEPAAVVWDGNGRMYVLEMRTYMQDIDGENQLDPVSRVSRHEDTDGDGVYDKHTVFADNLALPRMILPLLDRVIIRETNTLDLKSYQDTDGDGVADKVEMWHEGGPRGGNLEHQPSGLIWNIDNWLYTTYSRHRYRFTDGEVVRESLPHGAGQWGLTHDDVGRIFYSLAGGENPATDFQRPIVYGRISLPGEQADGFREVFPIDDVPDTQGGRGRLREDNTLNRFTASCGQSVYRGDRLPTDVYGDLFICEPVGRLVRRAKVTNDEGRIVLSNAYEGEEFLSSTDPNFRPINSATGPDGALYLVDMYRGIIQEGNWVREGSYLRGVVQEYELDKNIGRGRIFRIEHTSTVRGPQPRMLDETPAELVAHLSHPNGWWRSEAQKLIILHGDQAVVPALQRLASEGEIALGRLHALWTLEGLGAVDADLLRLLMSDGDRDVRSAAMRIAEPMLSEDRSLDAGVKSLATDADPDVAIQVLLSVLHGEHPEAEELVDAIVEAHPENVAVQGIAEGIQAHLASILAERRRIEELRLRDLALAEAVVRGERIYANLCITCHGADGKGLPSPDQDGLMLAPSLAGSPRVNGHKSYLLRILLHGLIGPIEGETYAAGLMLPMGANDDQWVADVATYIRNSWDNQAPVVLAEDVARIRKYDEGRSTPWTMQELFPSGSPTLEQRDKWVLTASHNGHKVGNSVDGNPGSRWDTGTPMRPGMWFQIELPEPARVLSLTLDTRGSDRDFPRGYEVRLSDDGETWSDVVARGAGTYPMLEIELDEVAATRFVRIDQTGQTDGLYWSIHELDIEALPPVSDDGVASLAEQLAQTDPAHLAEQALTFGDALRGAELFYDPTVSCARCHDPASGERLGPDLASKRDGVDAAFLVQSILEPSASIREGYESHVVRTEDGLVLAGFFVSEDDELLVLRESAAGKELEVWKDEIETHTMSKLSAMPAGLVNQLEGPREFLDLARFLIDIEAGGAARQTELREKVKESD